MNYQYFNSLIEEAEIPEDGILTRTLHDDDHSKTVLFAFSAGQELSEHTSSMPAILYFLSGEAQLTLGNDSHEASAGTWVHMPPKLPHSIHATTELQMVLVLIKGGAQKT